MFFSRPAVHSQNHLMQQLSGSNDLQVSRGGVMEENWKKSLLRAHDFTSYYKFGLLLICCRE